MRASCGWILVALSAVVLVSLLVIAWVARSPDRKQCVPTQVFTTQVLRGNMEVAMKEEAAAHAGHWHREHSGVFGLGDLWQGLGRSQSRQPTWGPVAWGPILEDDSTDDSMHCGQMIARMDTHTVMGERPTQGLAVGCGEEVLCHQNVADPGTGTIYACDNVNLQSFVPLVDFNATRANDVWGWTDPETGSEYAIIGLYEGTGFVDITNPTRPVLVGFLPTATTSSIWRDIKVFGNRAYIVSEATGHGMQVFDLTRLRGRTSPPASPDTADFRSEDTNSSHNVAINTETGRAYVVGARWLKKPKEPICEGGLVIFDISDPDATKPPRFEGCYSEQNYTHDVQCVVYHGEHSAYKGREICFAYNTDSLAIVDVSRAPDGEWREPTLISRTTYDSHQYTHQGWLDENHAYAYFNDELDEYRTAPHRTRTFIMDVRNLEKPVLVAIHQHDTTSIDHNNYVKDGFLYQANYCAGLRVLRVNADATLDEVAYFDTTPECDDNLFQGAWSVYPWFPSGNIVVSDMFHGLFVVKANLPPSTPTASS